MPANTLRHKGGRKYRGSRKRRSGGSPDNSGSSPIPGYFDQLISALESSDKEEVKALVTDVQSIQTKYTELTKPTPAEKDEKSANNEIKEEAEKTTSNIISDAFSKVLSNITSTQNENKEESNNDPNDANKGPTGGGRRRKRKSRASRK